MNFLRKALHRFRLWRCDKFGHHFRQIDMLIFEIKTNAINNDPNAVITCRRCGKDFGFNQPEE